ncbi:hypothetical protein M3Y98_01165600 [Aphelenchoides besseyi]|nr:hypothetical protein M3Y98_01165600 [Aphelenchoides besseyi]KAI6210912.1 hypothetical protein M3Y96_00378000 [Aphelenchoides besseyi]
MQLKFWLVGLFAFQNVISNCGQYYPYTGYPWNQYDRPYGYGYNDFNPWWWYYGYDYNWYGNWYSSWYWSWWWTYYQYMIWYYKGSGWYFDSRDNTYRPYSKADACTWCMNYWIPLVGEMAAHDQCPSSCSNSTKVS